MKTEEIRKIQHDLNSATDSISHILEMILDGTITNQDEEILNEAIKKMYSLKEKHQTMIQELTKSR